MALDRKARTLLFPRIGKFSMVIFALLLVIASYRAFELFGFIFKANVTQNAVMLIQTGSEYPDVEKIITDRELIHNLRAFKWVSKKKGYIENIRPGRYELKKGANTNELVNMLRIGQQSPVNVTFNNVRYFDELAGRVSRYFEADSLAFINEFTKAEYTNKYGFTPETFSAMFVPNTYQMYWTTTPEQFIERMHSEYNKFWNNERKEKAATLNLTPVEVSTLASIVQEETIKEDEKSRVAGVYLNRLKRGMLLQADPTIKFAMNDFSIRRINKDMLTINSPYNTYRRPGLPPGPINFPETSSLEAVLNAENHDYLYMCAKDDFSGYHNFAHTLQQHNINAAKYRRALNENKIWR
jgi:UPF0755 protein